MGLVANLIAKAQTLKKPPLTIYWNYRYAKSVSVSNFYGKTSLTPRHEMKFPRLDAICESLLRNSRFLQRDRTTQVRLYIGRKGMKER